MAKDGRQKMMTHEWFDTHCHLNYDYAPKSVDQLVSEADQAGVKTLVTIGVDPESIATIQDISDRFPSVYHTLGFHPHEAALITDEHLDLVRSKAKHSKCRAIGEIGLDYYYDHSPREVQRRCLDRQLELALELGLPIVIHSRDGENDLYPALAHYSQSVKPGIVPGLLHCFSGSREFAEKAVDLGFYVSLSGIITFKKADDLRATVAALPLEKLLIETDSPYLAPVPFRGKKCEPSMVVETGKKLAEIVGKSVEETARITTENAKRFFRIDS